MYIIGLVIKVQDEWSDFWRPQVAMYRSCNLF